MVFLQSFAERFKRLLPKAERPNSAVAGDDGLTLPWRIARRGKGCHLEPAKVRPSDLRDGGVAGSV